MNKKDIQQIIDTAHYWQDRTLGILDILHKNLEDAKDREDIIKENILTEIINEIMEE